MEVNQKEIAVEMLTKLNIYKPYITKFKSKAQTVTVFENFGGFYIEEDTRPKLFKKIREWEKATGHLVYAVTHEIFEFGECYSFLIVPNFEDYEESEIEYELGNMREDIKDGYAFAFVWNVDDDYCSEYGTVALTSFGGGIKRIG